MNGTKSLFSTLLSFWLPIIISVTIAEGGVYVTAQQNYRQSLNDPQIQMTEDGARAIVNGVSPESILPAGKVDLSVSLAPYLTVFDHNNGIIASNGLDGTIPNSRSGAYFV